MAANSDFAGEWAIDPDAGTAIDPWSRILLSIEVDGDAVTIERTFTTGRRTDTQLYPLEIGEEVPVELSWWGTNRHIGAYIGEDHTEHVRSEWLDDGRTLRTESHLMLETSQGETPLRTYAEYRLSLDGDELTVIQLRSSRDRPVVHVFKRS